MACRTRCVLSWETNRRRESPVHGRSPQRLTRLLSQDPNSRFEFARAESEGAVIESHLLDLGSKLVFCSAQSLLEATQKLVLLAVGKRQIVVSQLTVFLL